MIDFHTHLDLYPNPLSVAQETSRRNIFTLAVTTSPRAWLATTKVLRELPNIKIALGLHPEIVLAKESERDLLLELVAKSEFIGETGLDGSPQHKPTLALQISILNSLLKQCASHGGRIISLHSRRAVTQVLDILDKHPDAGTPILHWFSGSNAELTRAVQRGCWFSFGPAGIRTKAGKDTLMSIPLDRLIPESDGPFACLNGVGVMPWEASNIIRDISASRRLSEDFVAAQFRVNVSKILGDTYRVPWEKEAGVG